MKTLLLATLAAVATVTVGAVAVTAIPEKDVIVNRIIDGDTIEVTEGKDNFRVRLLNVDTPEIGKECLAEEARNYLASLLPTGTKVQLEYDEERTDKYGRTLAAVFKDDLLVNARIAEEGFGMPMSIAPNTKYLAQVSSAATQARADRKGIYGVGPECFISDQETLQQYQKAKTVIATSGATQKSTRLNLNSTINSHKELLLAITLLSQLKEKNLQQTDFQRELYGDAFKVEIEEVIEQGDFKAATFDRLIEEERDRREQQSIEKEKAEREEAERVAAEEQRQLIQQSTASNQQNFTQTAPTAVAPSVANPVDTYTGCRAYGGNYALTNMDDKGRMYAKIDCTSKVQIG